MYGAEIYMRGWKISKIVHMFTQPQIRLEGGQTDSRTEKDRQQ